MGKITLILKKLCVGVLIQLFQYKYLQNGELISNINFESDVRLSDLTVPLELIQKVFLMSCNAPDPDCSMPGGAITDFNIWDRSFSSADLQAWTACRYLHK